MRLLIVLSALVLGSLASPTYNKAAPDCDTAACNLPNCRCFQTGNVPGGFQPSEIPQMVLLTFDDAVSQLLFDNYYDAALTGRQNPNGCEVSATFFTTHEYTDYSVVNLLYNFGHEIALHSITHTTTTQYWNDASVQVLTDEFAGERQTIAKFANIPESDITGVRTPFLQIAGDKTFQVMQENGFYDVSWPTQTHIGNGLFPYTLDYLSNQDCRIGVCPTEAHPGAWVVPMVDWVGANGEPCAMVDACTNGASTKDELFSFIETNFKRHYEGWREPFGFYVHAAWFQSNATNFEAYVQFLDYLTGLPDVYIVSASQAVKWTQNPTNIAGAAQTFSCEARDAPCTPKTCNLEKPNEGTRYMKQCLSDCPPKYPWIGNPLGQ